MATVTLPFTEQFEDQGAFDSSIWTDTGGKNRDHVIATGTASPDLWAPEGLRCAETRLDGTAGTNWKTVDFTTASTSFTDFYFVPRSFNLTTRADYAGSSGAKAIMQWLDSAGAVIGKLMVWESNGAYKPAGEIWLALRIRPSSTWKGQDFGIRIDDKWDQVLRFRVELRFTNDSTANDGYSIDIWEPDGTKTSDSNFTFNGTRTGVGKFRVGFASPGTTDVGIFRWDDVRIAATAIGTAV